MAQHLDIELEQFDEKVILRVEGRLDAASTPILEKKINALLEEGYSSLAIDFSSVEYLSSAGMRLLLSVTKNLKKKEGDLILFSIDEEVMEIIKMAGFENLFHICSTEKEALQE
ncbi:MAG: STAS domain-containing protein [Parachlamydiales bacterium]|nr:STAS domain-containing protein [Parachlamydiales bacterium]